MLQSLRVTGFRAFPSFAMEELTRVNLLVGANNSGKTCLLEAVEILAAGGQPWVLLRSPTRRHENASLSSTMGSKGPLANMTHLFHGHEIALGRSFSIEGHNESLRYVRCRLVSMGSKEPADNPRGQDSPTHATPGGLEAEEIYLMLAIEGDRTTGTTMIPLEARGGLPIQVAHRASDPSVKSTTCNFIGSDDPEYRLAALWDRVVLTPTEGNVVDALRIVEPGIERVAALSSDGGEGRGRMLLKMAGSDQRVPLGSMGDGLKRLLVVSVNLASAAEGILLVDEIDTGLHYSAMTKMWKLVIETSRKLDVQVFATTHSLDCLRALAWACDEQPDLSKDVSVHRLERGKAESARFRAPVFLEAMKHDYEVR